MSDSVSWSFANLLTLSERAHGCLVRAHIGRGPVATAGQPSSACKRATSTRFVHNQTDALAHPYPALWAPACRWLQQMLHGLARYQRRLRVRVALSCAPDPSRTTPRSGSIGVSKATGLAGGHP